jgi:hypothetical protein
VNFDVRSYCERLAKAASRFKFDDGNTWVLRDALASTVHDQAVKAWHIATDFDSWDGGHLLVYAETRGTAKALALRHGPWEYESFTDIKCRRRPDLDGLFDQALIVETNDDLPAGASFYSDVEYYPLIFRQDVPVRSIEELQESAKP